MKLAKLFTLFTLSSLLVFNTTYANETNQKQKARQTKPQTKQQNKQQAKQDQKNATPTATPIPSAQESLAEFNKNVVIQLVGRRIEMDQNNQRHTVFTYSIKNTGKNQIKAVHWVSAYTIYDNIFYTKDIPINFNPTLKAGTEVRIELSEPFSTLPDMAQRILGYLPNRIGVINGAKSLTFAEGKQVIMNK